MLARVHSAAIAGVEAIPLVVECDISRGLPGVHTVGLPDAAVRESSERVRAALRHAGFDFPPRRITISLAPADLRKAGSAFDLPIALGILAACGQIPAAPLATALVLGELALDGSVRGVPGCLPAALLARREGIAALIVPHANRAEALAVPGRTVHGVATLREAVDAAAGGAPGDRGGAPPYRVERDPLPDLADLRGQPHARRALEVAAAGGHHLLMVGPPGCGKTMLARRLPGILPPATLDEAIEITSIYSAAGLLHEPGLMGRRPFRAPHHTTGGVALVGGGRGPRPGEVTLAHRGVLFLDELAEFGRGTLDVLRQPLEDGEVRIARTGRTVRMPARFMLVGAMNPCVCGQRGRTDRPCTCTPAMVARYRGRVSGPLLDRFDLQVEVAPLPGAALRRAADGEGSAAVAARVAAARERRAPGDDAAPDDAARRILLRAASRLGLSGRAHDAIVRVARTIARLEGSSAIEAAHVAEAAQYRAFDLDAGARGEG